MSKGVSYYAIRDIAKDGHLKPNNTLLLCKYTRYLNRLLGLHKINKQKAK